MSGAADPLGGTAFLYYHITLPLVNTFFLIFKNFFEFFRPSGSNREKRRKIVKNIERQNVPFG